MTCIVEDKIICLLARITSLSFFCIGVRVNALHCSGNPFVHDLKIPEKPRFPPFSNARGDKQKDCNVKPEELLIIFFSFIK
jgi:hypothetical protein